MCLIPPPGQQAPSPGHPQRPYFQIRSLLRFLVDRNLRVTWHVSPQDSGPPRPSRRAAWPGGRGLHSGRLQRQLWPDRPHPSSLPSHHLLNAGCKPEPALPPPHLLEGCLHSPSPGGNPGPGRPSAHCPLVSVFWCERLCPGAGCWLGSGPVADPRGSASVSRAEDKGRRGAASLGLRRAAPGHSDTRRPAVWAPICSQDGEPAGCPTEQDHFRTQQRGTLWRTQSPLRPAG